MAEHTESILRDILVKADDSLLDEWVRAIRARRGETRLGEPELRAQCGRILRELGRAAREGRADDVTGPAFEAPRELLAELSRARAQQGYSPSETAYFVFSLKDPLFQRVRQEHGGDPDRMATEGEALNALVDQLGIYTMEVFQKGREEVITRQQQELADLSTPVVKLWEGIVALPLIGTLDSSRTQVVMENLLEALVNYEAEIAIIDITGVPTVDTLVAQHLLRTVAAARLMGADCLISGIRPQIAQTMVHLGINLDVVTKSTLADAFAYALRRIGRTVTAVARPAAGPADRGL